MRKILLASTALVALGTVSATAADITISGSSEFVADMSDDATSSFDSDTDVNIKFSNTTDSGISTALDYGFDESRDADDIKTTISGDFGSITYTVAGDDNIVSANDIEAAATPEEKGATLTTGADVYTGAIPSAKTHTIMYTLPSLVDGMTVGFSAGNDSSDEQSGVLVKYSTGPVTAVYGQINSSTQTDTHAGVAVAMGPLSIEVAKNTSDRAAHDDDATLMSIEYTMGDLVLSAMNHKGETGTAAEDYSLQAIGAKYTVAPGIAASITSSDQEAENGSKDSSYTSVGVHVSF